MSHQNGSKPEPSDRRKVFKATTEYLIGVVLGIAVAFSAAAAFMAIPVGLGVLFDSEGLGVILGVAEAIIGFAYLCARYDLKNGKL